MLREIQGEDNSAEKEKIQDNVQQGTISFMDGF